MFNAFIHIIIHNPTKYIHKTNSSMFIYLIKKKEQL